MRGLRLSVALGELPLVVAGPNGVHGEGDGLGDLLLVGGAGNVRLRPLHDADNLVEHEERRLRTRLLDHLVKLLGQRLSASGDRHASLLPSSSPEKEMDGREAAKARARV